MGAFDGADPPGSAASSFPLTRCHREFRAKMRTGASVMAVAQVDSQKRSVVDAPMNHGMPGCG